MEKKCLCDLTAEHQENILEICRSYADNPGSLISILNDVQEYFGYLPMQVQQLIADETGVSLNEVYSVVTFYSRFSVEPVGKYKVSVCLGTACYVKGAQLLVDDFARRLDVKAGETREDGEYTLEATRCIGACGLAPILTVNDKVYGNVPAEDVAKIVKEMEDGM